MTTTIGVVGAGTMGTGVAQLFAEHGHDVVLVDRDDGALARARTEIERSVWLIPLVRPAAGPRDPAQVTGRIRFTTELKELADAGFVVENITERWDLKREVYDRLDELCPADTVLGVNTSAIPITKVAARTGRPASVVGTHFMNPVVLKPTVEVIRGHHTAAATVERTRALLAAVGRDTIVVEDSPGFVTNRVAMLTVNEAAFVLAEGVAGAPEIDRLFRECLGHAMGPLATADLIGLDTVLLSLEVLQDEFDDPKFRPCPLLKRLVRAGLLGRKTGQGFHTYEGGLHHG